MTRMEICEACVRRELRYAPALQDALWSVHHGCCGFLGRAVSLEKVLKEEDHPCRYKLELLMADK